MDRALLRVQVVDDNEALRAVARIEVQLAEGMELVGEAADGAEAIEVAVEQRPDVILLDVQMPRMDGLEALPHLCEAVPDAAVVMYSSRDCDRARAHALRLGARAYVVKGSMALHELLADVRDDRLA